MTTEQHIQQSDIHPINGSIDLSENKINNDKPTTAITTNTSSDPKSRQSRFFRTKRKQRLGDNPTNTNGESKLELSTCNVPKNFEKSQPRTVSPPPPSQHVNASDDSDDNTSSIEGFNIPKIVITQARQSITMASTGYSLKKSHSVKLTRLDHEDTSPKKAVRFADDFGLDLSQIRVIKTDELPSVPSTAFKHLQISNDFDTTTPAYQREKLITYMEPQFENPIHTPDFNDRVSRGKVVLEQANAIDNRIYGTIKLVSFGINKRVRTRFTTDNWITCTDIDAVYITNSYDGTYDRFSFKIEIDRHRICAGSNIQFSICYDSFVSTEYWDNNFGQNYRFDCFTRAIPDYTL